MHCICRDEEVQALIVLKTGKAVGSSGLSLELVVVSGEIGLQVIVELFQSSRWIVNAS